MSGRHITDHRAIIAPASELALNAVDAPSKGAVDARRSQDALAIQHAGFELELAALRVALAERERALKSEQAKVQAAHAELVILKDASARLANDLLEMRRSTSWQVSAPLRGLRRALQWRPRMRAALGPVVRQTMRLYGRVPLSQATRLRVRQAVARVSPDFYKRLLRTVGAPAVLPPQTPMPSDPLWLSDVVDNSAFRAGFWRLGHDLADFADRSGPISHLIALPFFATGGAEATAASFARAVTAHARSSAVLIAVDRTLAGVDRFAAPDRVLMLDLTDYFPEADYNVREALLLYVLKLCRPDVLHIINSEVAWRLLIKIPDRIRGLCRVFGSIFAFQFDWKTGERVGYAETFLRAGLPHVDALLSDNKRFLTDATEAYQLHAAHKRMITVYNPCRDFSPEAQADARKRLEHLSRNISRASRLQVLWAGRLDGEKRPELILEAAQLCPDMDFHVYGAGVVDGGFAATLVREPNVRLHGPFKSPADCVSAREHHVFMFTSRWEGMPNVVIEFGALGLPVIAATVGGVGELIDNATGFPLPERPDAAAYAEALRWVKANPDQAARRSLALRNRIEKRHSRESFALRVAEIPGYLGEVAS
jgi:glycosyltransferase involved in cell wall biosynthesis